MVTTGQQGRSSCPRRGLTATRSLPLPSSLQPPLQVCLWFGDELTQLREMKKSLRSSAGPIPHYWPPRPPSPSRAPHLLSILSNIRVTAVSWRWGGPHRERRPGGGQPLPPSVPGVSQSTTTGPWHWKWGAGPWFPTRPQKTHLSSPPESPRTQPGRKRDLLSHLLHTQSTPGQGRLRGSTLCKMPAKLLPSDQPSDRGHLGARGSPAQLQ